LDITYHICPHGTCWRSKMTALTVPLWLALAGALLQFVSLGTDFYLWEGTRQTAWFGVPHTSELIVLSALVAGGLVGLIAANRSPLPGQNGGLPIGPVGLLATLQLIYRMIPPPFGGRVPEHATIVGDSCLYYCWPSEAASADLLPGIWMALAGSLMVTLGGFAHALAPQNQHLPARSWRAQVRPRMNGWLGLRALGAIGQFGFGYTFFTFYRTIRQDGTTTWSGWLPTPHTGSVVLAVTALVVGLVWSVSRGRPPLAAAPIGAVIAVLGFVSTARI